MLLRVVARPAPRARSGSRRGWPSVSPARMRSRLVLPAPFRPSTSRRSPRPRSNDTSSNTGGPPYAFDRWVAVRTVPPHWRRVGEADAQRAVAGADLDPLRLEAGDLLLLAVRHGRLRGLGAEAIDDRLQAGDLLRLQRGHLGEPLLVLGPRRLVLACRCPCTRTPCPRLSSFGPVEVDARG